MRVSGTHCPIPVVLASLNIGYSLRFSAALRPAMLGTQRRVQWFFIFSRRFGTLGSLTLTQRRVAVYVKRKPKTTIVYVHKVILRSMNPFPLISSVHEPIHRSLDCYFLVLPVGSMILRSHSVS